MLKNAYEEQKIARSPGYPHLYYQTAVIMAGTEIGNGLFR